MFTTIVCSFAARCLIIYLFNLDLSYLQNYVFITGLLYILFSINYIFYDVFGFKPILCEGTNKNNINAHGKNRVVITPREPRSPETRLRAVCYIPV